MQELSQIDNKNDLYKAMIASALNKKEPLSRRLDYCDKTLKTLPEGQKSNIAETVMMVVAEPEGSYRALTSHFNLGYSFLHNLRDKGVITNTQIRKTYQDKINKALAKAAEPEKPEDPYSNEVDSYK